MPLRKVRGKATKNKGIYEYFLKSDPNKATCGYYFSYTAEDGKSTRIKADAKTLPEVISERAAKIAAVKAGKKLSKVKEDLTLDTLIKDYIASRVKKANAVKDEQKYFNHVSPVLGSKMVSEVSVDDIKKLRIKLFDKGLSDATVANILIVLKAMLNHAEALEMTTQRPFSKKVNNQAVIKVKKQRSTRVRVLTDQEMKDLFKSAEKRDSRLFFMFNMLYYTLQRPQSILSLKCADIDLENSRISLGEIKGQKARFIPISKKLKPMLQEWIKDKEQYEPVVDLSYSRMSTLAQEIFAPLNDDLYSHRGSKETVQAAKVAAYKEQRHKWASMYSFRHTSATNVYRANHDIKLVKELLGHSDFAMTEIYAKISDAQMQGGVDAL